MSVSELLTRPQVYKSAALDTYQKVASLVNSQADRLSAQDANVLGNLKAIAIAGPNTSAFEGFRTEGIAEMKGSTAIMHSGSVHGRNGVYFPTLEDVHAWNGIRDQAALLAHEAFHGYEEKANKGMYDPAKASLSFEERQLYNEKLASGFAFQFYGKLTNKVTAQDRANLLRWLGDSLKGHLDWHQR